MATRTFYIDQDGTQVFFVPDDEHVIIPQNGGTVLVGVHEADDGFRVDGEFDLHFVVDSPVKSV